MAVQPHVRNPIEWGWDHLKETGQAIGSAASTMDGAWEAHGTAPPVVRRIGLDDLRQALREGARDFGACRTDVIFLCMIYPIAGLIISRFAFDYGMLALIFPLVSGFALICAAVRRRSLRDEPSPRTRHRHRLDGRLRGRALSGDRLDPGAGPGAARLCSGCGCVAAYFIYTVTLGPDLPVSAIAFARDALTTPQGWTMIGVGSASASCSRSWCW